MIFDYNLLFCHNFVNSKLHLNYILWFIVFVTMGKSLKKRSLEHFGSSENKVLPQNKVSKRSFHNSGEVAAVDEK